MPAALASDSDSEEEDSDSSPRDHSQRSQRTRSMRTADAAAQHCLENALVVWQFQSIVRELMDAEAAELEAEHAKEPTEQEHHVQSDIAGASGSESVEADTEARRTADEVTLAAVHDHEAGLEGAAQPPEQNASDSLEEVPL